MRSLEELIGYVRNRQPSVEIMELKVLGKVQEFVQFGTSGVRLAIKVS